MTEDGLEEVEQHAATARSTTLADDAAFAAAWAEGRALTLDQAMELATVQPDA